MIVRKHPYVKLITPKENLISIIWTVTTTCNYQCSYCPPNLHNGKYRWPEYDNVKRFIDDLKTLHPKAELCFEIIGGEPTLWPQLPEFLTYCKEINCGVELVSNGSRKPRWWTEHADKPTNIVLSYHPEQADFDNFVQVIEAIGQKTTLMVNVMAPPTHFEQSLSVFQQLRKQFPNMGMSLKPARVDFGQKLYPYTDEQMAIFKQLIISRSAVKTHDPNVIKPRFEALVQDENGNVTQYDDRQEIIRGNNSWTGWDCHAGLQHLVIKEDGSIYRGFCGVGGVLGNIYTTWTLPSSTVVCTQDICPCLSEIFVNKTHPMYNG